MGGHKIDKIRFSKFLPEVIACGGEAGVVQAWDINTEKTICKFDNHSAPIKGLEFSSVNNMLLCSNSLDRKVIFYDIRANKFVRSTITEEPCTSLSFFFDGCTLAVGGL